jgi:hypothetical protein
LHHPIIATARLAEASRKRLSVDPHSSRITGSRHLALPCTWSHKGSRQCCLWTAGAPAPLRKVFLQRNTSSKLITPDKDFAIK